MQLCNINICSNDEGEPLSWTVEEREREESESLSRKQIILIYMTDCLATHTTHVTVTHVPNGSPPSSHQSLNPDDLFLSSLRIFFVSMCFPSISLDG